MKNKVIKTYRELSNAGLILNVIVILAFSQAKAQNANYSQYKDTPFFTNPALVASKSETSLSIINRSQPLTDIQKYNTTSLMLVMPLLDAKQTKRWGGWGLSLLNDEIKGGFEFSTQGISGIYAYNLTLSPKHFISIGMQAGYYQRKIALNGLSTSSQWIDNVGFVSTGSTGETMYDGRKNYITISSGLLYYLEDTEHRHVAKFGVATFGINQPDRSSTNRKDVIPLKITAHGSVALMRSKNILINGEMLFYRENFKSTYHAGARATYSFDNNTPFGFVQAGSIDFKAGYRVNNAITTEFQFHQPNFTIAFGYDFGVATKESYRSPTNVTEFLFSLTKVIGTKKMTKVKRPQTYTSIGKVREFYFTESGNQSAANTKQEKDSSVQMAPVLTETFKLKHDFKFGFNQASLNEESKAYLDDLITLLKGNKSIKLEVIGHTDNVGSISANKNVSMERAKIVIDYLIQKGISTDKVKATAMGDKEPLVPNTSEVNKALNRRVEFVIYNP